MSGRASGGEPCVATVDLGQIERVSSIQLHALQDIKPWIWSPEQVVFSASSDGEQFDVIERVPSQLTDRDEEVNVETFTCNKSIDARYVRVETVSRGLIPDWHLMRQPSMDIRGTRSWWRLPTDTTFVSCRMPTTRS